MPLSGPVNLISNVGTSDNPSLTVFKGGIWMAWKGQQTDPSIYVASTGGNLTPTGTSPPYYYYFSPQQKIAGTATKVAPTIFSYEGLLYLFWSDAKTGEIWWTNSKDGTTWASNEPIGIVNSDAPLGLGDPTPPADGRAITEHAPQAISAAGVLYLFYTGKSGHIWTANYQSETWWQVQLEGTSGGGTPETNDPPAVTVAGDTVHLVWKGSSDNQLWWSNSPLPTGDPRTDNWSKWSWTPQKQIFGKAVTPPALITAGDGLVWLTWVNPPYEYSLPWNTSSQDCYWSSNQLCYASLDSNKNWSPPSTRLGVIPATRTAMVSIGNDHAHIFMAWKNPDPDLGIHYGPLGLASNTYQFAVTDIHCQVTRSGNALEFIDSSSDTNYSSLSVQRSTGGSSVTATMFCGDMGEGSDYAGAGFPATGPGSTAPQGSTTPVVLTVPDNAQVIMAYGVSNLSGPTPEMTQLVSSAAEKLAAAGASAAASAAGTAIGAAIGSALGTGAVPLVGSALGALAGWAVSEAWGWAFPNCDGPVAYAVRTFSAADLATSFAGVTHGYYPGSEEIFQATDALSVTDQQPSPGMQPPMVTQSGCGANPQYQITWGIACTATQYGTPS